MPKSLANGPDERYKSARKELYAFAGIWGSGSAPRVMGAETRRVNIPDHSRKALRGVRQGRQGAWHR